MFFQHALKPKELLKVITSVRECFFTVSAKLVNRDYYVAVYKYNEEYFVLKDSRLFEQVEGISRFVQGDEEQLLPYIENSLEDNLYFLVEENYVSLDLNTLTQAEYAKDVCIRYYEFIDI